MVEQEQKNQQPAGKHGNARNKPQNRWARLRTWIKVRWRWTRIRWRKIACWAVVIVLVVGSLVALSRYVSGDTDPIQFVTGNLLNVLIFAAIVAQVLIYRKQRDIMQQQWQVMREQSAETERAFVLANRGSVSIHSVEMDKAQNAVLVRVENTGNMPAEQITLFLKLVSFGPVEGLESGDPSQEVKSSSVREDYGRTKLFKGNLPIVLSFYLRSKWTDNDLRNIEKGKDGLFLIGYVQYGDGFSVGPDQRTEFFFNYHPELGVWSAGPPEEGDIVGWDEE